MGGLSLLLLLGLAQAARPSTGEQVEAAAQLAFGGDHPASIALLDEVLDASPDELGARLLRARVLGWAGRHREAAAEWTALQAEHPEHAEVWAGTGSLALAQGRPEAATEAFSTALARQPDHAEAREGLSTAEGLHRTELRLGVETWTWMPDQPGLGGDAALSFQPRSRVGLRAAASTGQSLGPDLLPQSTRLDRAEAELTLRTRQGWTLSAGPQATWGAVDWTGVSLGGTVPVGPLRLGGSWRPGQQRGGGPSDQLVRIGVSAGGQTWAQAQLFRWWNTDGEQATSGALTVGHEVDALGALRLDLALTRGEVGWIGTTTAGWTSPWWGRHGAALEASAMAGAVDRLGLQAAWRVRW